MPTVAVRFFATLRRYAPPGRERDGVSFALAPGARVADLLALLGIPEEEDLAVVVGNRIVMPHYALEDGETVLLLPPVVGG